MTASFIASAQEPSWLATVDQRLVRLSQILDELDIFAGDPEYLAHLHCEAQENSHHYQ